MISKRVYLLSCLGPLHAAAPPASMPGEIAGLTASNVTFTYTKHLQYTPL
jgi:hypothetical protein